MVVNLVKLKKKVNSLKKQIKADNHFLKSPASKIAEHFKLRRKQSGFIMHRSQWEKTMLWAERVLTDVDTKHITIDDWVECIDWCFSDFRLSIKFWSTVKFTSFYTCTCAYNDFNSWRKTQKLKVNSNRIEYGKK